MDVVSKPTGIVTFVFTDVEGSTVRWERSPEGMRAALAAHDCICRESFVAYGGFIFKTVGDAFCVAFKRPEDAIRSAVDIQRRTASQIWPSEVGELRVRIGVHTGSAVEADGDYFGTTVNRTQRLMALGHGGQILVSSAVLAVIDAASLAGIDFTDLGQHRLRDLERAETAYQVVAEGLAAIFPPLRSIESRPNNLPSPLSSFVGRDAELRDLHALLRDSRLTTVTGPGGIGKTRVALQAARDALEHFADGVWFVGLESISDSHLLVSAVATALRVSEIPTVPLLSSLLRYLANKHALLIFDNSEQIEPPVASLAAEILKHCPAVSILVTSRQPLHIQGEQVFRLDALDISAARALFEDRARSSVSGFAPTGADIEEIAAICRAVECVPLAVELAAARIRVLSPHQIRERIAKQLTFLTSSGMDERHRSLRATIEWSYNLLDVRERELFESLAVFSGGFTFDACEAVTASEESVLDTLESLVDKSLVVAERSALHVRYRLLEAIGQFALGRCSAQTLESARSRHFAYFAGLAGAASVPVAGDRLKEWLETIAADVANVRAALSFGIERSEPSLLAMLLGLYRFWYVKRTIAEGIAWLKAYIERFADETISSAKVLRMMSTFASISGDHQRAEEFAQSALAIFRAGKDVQGEIEALHALAVNEQRRADNDRAEQHFSEIARLSDLHGLQRSAITSRANMALLALQRRDFDRAASLLEESGKRAQSTGDEDLKASITALSGAAAYERGEIDAAERAFEKARSVKSVLGNEFGAEEVGLGLAAVRLAQGDVEGARALVQEGVKAGVRLDSYALVTIALETGARIAIFEGDFDRALQRVQEANAIRRRFDYRDTSTLDLEKTRAELRERFGDSYEDRVDDASYESWKETSLRLLTSE